MSVPLQRRTVTSTTTTPESPSSGVTWRELLRDLFAKAFQNKIRNPDTLTPYLPVWLRETKSATVQEAQAWAQLLVGLLGEALLLHIHPRNIITIHETSVTPSPERDSMTLLLEPAEPTGLGLERADLQSITSRKSVLEGTGFGGGVMIVEGDAVQYRVRSNRTGKFVKADRFFPIGLFPRSEEEPFISQVQEIFQSGRVEVDLLFQIITLQGVVSESEQPELISWLANILRQRKLERITQVVQRSAYTPSQKEDIAELLSREPINTSLLQRNFGAVHSAIFSPKNAEAWKLFGLVTSTNAIRRLTALTYLRLLRDYQLQRVFLTQATARLQAAPRRSIIPITPVPLTPTPPRPSQRGRKGKEEEEEETQQQYIRRLERENRTAVEQLDATLDELNTKRVQLREQADALNKLRQENNQAFAEALDATRKRNLTQAQLEECEKELEDAKFKFQRDGEEELHSLQSRVDGLLERLTLSQRRSERLVRLLEESAEEARDKELHARLVTAVQQGRQLEEDINSIKATIAKHLDGEEEEVEVSFMPSPPPPPLPLPTERKSTSPVDVIRQRKRERLQEAVEKAEQLVESHDTEQGNVMQMLLNSPGWDKVRAANLGEDTDEEDDTFWGD